MSTEMLVDTSVWIEFFKGRSGPEVNQLKQSIADGDDIHLCGIILTEILMGLKSERQASKISDLLQAFKFTPDPTLDDYREAASLYRACRKRGLTVRSTIDCLIAQICLREQLPLLSRDRDFKHIAKHQPLKLVGSEP